MSRILLVEDDHSLRRLLCQYVEEFGYLTVGVGSVKEARELKEERWDLLIIDRHLQDGDGLEVARLFFPVPFITISGSVHENVDLYKPFDFEVFRQLIAFRLSEKQQQ